MSNATKMIQGSYTDEQKEAMYDRMEFDLRAVLSGDWQTGSETIDTLEECFLDYTPIPADVCEEYYNRLFSQPVSYDDYEHDLYICA